MNRRARRAQAAQARRGARNRADGVADRQWLLQHNIDTIDVAIRGCLEQGVSPDELVIMLVDAHDPLGGPWARRIAGAEAEEHEQRLAPWQFLTLTIASTRSEMADMMRDTNPDTAAALLSVQLPGRVPVVAVAGGGCLLVMHTLPEPKQHAAEA